MTEITFGYDVDDEPPVDPLYEEARLHVEAMLEWAEEEVQNGDGMTQEQYTQLFNDAVEEKYNELAEQRDAEIAEWTCECGQYIDQNRDIVDGYFVCQKCGKGRGSVNDYLDNAIPF